MTENVLETDVDQTLHDLIAPVRAQVAELDAAIEKKVAELDTMRSTRTKLKKALVLIDPSEPKPAPKAPKPDIRVAAETLANFTAWLQGHREEVNGNGGFTATSLIRDHGLTMLGQSTISKLLVKLHGDGLVRLDHRGRGGSKYYKVVG